MPEITALLIAALATARVTRLITTDEITSEIRQALLRRLDDQSKLAYAITCNWCASIYVAAATAPLVWWHSTRPAVMIPLIALAFSQIVGMTSGRD